MLDPEILTVLGRLALVGFVMIAPTIMFLGLWRGLHWLRDDACIERWLAETETDFEPAQMHDVVTVLRTGIDGTRGRTVSSDCPACGVENSTHVRFCSACLAKLS